MEVVESDEYIKKKIAAYKKAMKEKGGIKSLQWKDYSSAAKRHINLIDDSIGFVNKQILDVGCGFGDIIPYIYKNSKGKVFEYEGLDLVSEFIEEASLRYPEFNFSIKNFFSSKASYKNNFDIVLSSGALNASSFHQEEKILEYRKSAIKKMFDTSRYATAFNVAGGLNMDNKKSRTVYYADSRLVMGFFTELTDKFIFKHHYHNKDFTVILFK